MSWQYLPNDDASNDLHTILDSFTTFDESEFPSPKPFEGGCGNFQEPNGNHEISVDTNPAILTVTASIDAILQHVENEHNKGNTRRGVVVKLKDLAKRKSISITLGVLGSPATTAASSINGDSSSPMRCASPDANEPRDTHRALVETALPQSEELPHCMAELAPCAILNWTAALSAIPFPEHPDAVSNATPPMETGIRTQQHESLVEPITPEVSMPETWEELDDHLLLPTEQHGKTTSRPQVSAAASQIGYDGSPYTTQLGPVVLERNSMSLPEKPSVASPHDERTTALRSRMQRRHNGSRRLRETKHNTSTERLQPDSTDLAALFHNTTQYKTVQELTAGQDQQLILKMVRNAMAILPRTDYLYSTGSNATDVILHGNGHDSESREEDIMQKFCTTVRRIEWVEAGAFRAMVEYRVLFVQLYQHYLALQSIVDTKKGERRVAHAKARLFTLLYPNKPKLTGNGRTSDEWEVFNRWIRRGKQWHTIASKLGIGILQRMPASIRHSWVEQKLQTKEQLHIWIKIVQLLA